MYGATPYCNVYGTKPFGEAITGADTLVGQAKVLAEWGEAVIRRALALPAPPDTDREKSAPTKTRRGKPELT
jgi:hypothetical protein